MIDIFDKKEIDLTKLVCHSGGALGSDTVFEQKCKSFNIPTNAYSYKTKYHTSGSKVEISDADYEEGVEKIRNANKILKRFAIERFMNLLARNWAQVKYSDSIYAIGTIVEPGKKGSKYYSKANIQVVDGGTGYSVMMGIQHNKLVYVFDQSKDKWFRWSYTTNSFIETPDPKIETENFAGIGTREIKENGIKAIEDLLKRTFS